MDDRRQSFKPSGLPRPSRLSLGPSAPSSTFHTAGNTASTARSLRPVSSRSSLSGDVALGGGQLRNPKLRSAASRDRLSLGGPTPPPASPSPTLPGQRQPSLRSRAVSGQYTRTPPPPRSSLGASNIPNAKSSSTYASFENDNVFKKPAVPKSLARRPSVQPLTHTPSPPTSHSVSPVDEYIADGNIQRDDIQGNNDSTAAAVPSLSKVRSRPSLSERTMETLAQIPSSPAMRGKTSSFFDGPGLGDALGLGITPSRRRGSSVGSSSRPGSRLGTRPGSSFQADRGTSTSRPPSRPGSSSRQDDGLSSSFFRASQSSYRNASMSSILPIDETSTDCRLENRSRSGIRRPSSSAGTTIGSNGLATTRTLRGPSSRTSLNGAYRSGPRQVASQSPSDQKSGLSGVALAAPSTAAKSTNPVPSRFGAAAKTGPARTLQPRSSMSRLLKKPSISSLESVPSAAKPTAKVAAKPAPTVTVAKTVRKNPPPSKSSASSQTRTSPATSTATSATTVTDTTESAASTLALPAPSPAALTARKSSSALRDQIAKAKAAKRAAAAAAAKPVEDETEKTGKNEENEKTEKVETSAGAAAVSRYDTPVVPTDTTFDFGLSSAAALDPFGQNRLSPQQAHAKVIRARVEAARSGGRLNIAAMGLRAIPQEVMDMYKTETLASTGASWAESVDLTRFVAADNEMEMIEDAVFPDVDAEEAADNDDGYFNIFGGLETLDLHGNTLICLPMGLRRLQMLSSLNLSHNRITNNALEVISQILSLRDVKLAGNLFYGPLDPSFAKLVNLEVADLHNNNITVLPLTMGNMAKLRILNISENSFENIVFEPLSKLPLTELIVRKNKLSGVLIEDCVASLPSLQVLDVSANQITHLVSSTRTGPTADGDSSSNSSNSWQGLEMPKLHNLCVSMNRLQELPDVSRWTNLVTLAAEENNISNVPTGFPTLSLLRHADFSSNDIRVIPPEVGRMENLAMLRLSGNPLRDKKFSTATTDDIKATLATRLQPEPEPVVEPLPSPVLAPLRKQSTVSFPDMPVTSQKSGDWTTDELQGELRDAVTEMTKQTGTHSRRRSSNVGRGSTGPDDGASDGRSEDDFATPPTSAPQTPARSRAATLTGQTWPVKPGGVLDRSDTGSAALHPVIASRVAQEHVVREMHLQRNMFTTLPDALSFFAETLAVLSLARNQLAGESYLGATAASEGLDLPALRELNLSANHITGLGPLVQNLRAPSLQKLDVSVNRVATLPPGGQLRAAFPVLTVLLASDNRLAELDPASIEGLRVVDVTNNDIEHLNPRLGLLGGAGGLERLDVLGNRFRVPRFNVIERGTEATLRWLRGRVPVAEMGAWREANASSGEVDDEVD